MEEVIQIIFFIAIISIIVFKKSKDFNRNRPGQSVQPSADASSSIDDEFSDENEKIEEELSDEMFPKEEFLEEEFSTEDKDSDFGEYISDKHNYTKISTNIQESEKQKKKFVRSTLQSGLKKSEEPYYPGVIPPQETMNVPHLKNEIHHPLTQSEKGIEKEPLVRLRNRKEARRAFVYAEIFNRRYE